MVSRSRAAGGRAVVAAALALPHARHEVHRDPVLHQVEGSVAVNVGQHPKFVQRVLRDSERGPQLPRAAAADRVGLVLALRPPLVVLLRVGQRHMSAVGVGKHGSARGGGIVAK